MPILELLTDFKVKLVMSKQTVVLKPPKAPPVDVKLVQAETFSAGVDEKNGICTPCVINIENVDTATIATMIETPSVLEIARSPFVTIFLIYLMIIKLYINIFLDQSIEGN